MHNALKLARPVQLQQPSLSLTSFSLSNANHNKTLTPPYSLTRFVRTAASGPAEMDSNKQSGTDESKKKNDDPKSKRNDDDSATMSCFGEGYATRSDEEGFGGTYGGNQSLSKDDYDHNKNGQEFEHDQGSHVKEKEKSRNQKKAE